MKQTWRWFGPNDTIGIADLLQCGVEGVVTALYHIAPGGLWSVEEISARQAGIATLEGAEPSGLRWDVVESLPVSEAIKTQGPEMKAHLAAYKASLSNLAECGIETVCYNFMPVLDWTRTDLRMPMSHGGNAMAFDLVDFAAFDLFILGRPGAAEDYGEALTEAAQIRADNLTPKMRNALKNNIVAGLPGANDTWTIDQVREFLDVYADISDDRFRGHLVDFLSEVAPHAESLGLRLCCHPDDPPFSLLGLPRVMSSEADYQEVIEAVDMPANGITFCTGSLGVGRDFDAPGFVERLGRRIHFVHLRNTKRIAPDHEERSSFYEAAHLEGDTDLVATIRALLAEETRRRKEGRVDASIPMRPNHGQNILDDLNRDGMPGYPLIGRMRGLAEIRGVMSALS